MGTEQREAEIRRGHPVPSDLMIHKMAAEGHVCSLCDQDSRDRMLVMLGSRRDNISTRPQREAIRLAATYRTAVNGGLSGAQFALEVMHGLYSSDETPLSQPQNDPYWVSQALERLEYALGRSMSLTDAIKAAISSVQLLADQMAQEHSEESS